MRKSLADRSSIGDREDGDSAMVLRCTLQLALLNLSVLSSLVCAQADFLGDVDGNGIVEQIDADVYISHLLGLTPLDTSQEARANCNGQTGLDSGDLVWIVNHMGFPFPEMVSVPAGSFEMGWYVSGYDAEPIHQVTLSAYEIGRCEVTNAEYTVFLNDALISGDITVNEEGWVFLTDNSSDGLFSTYPSPSELSQIEYTGEVFSVRFRDGYAMDDHPVLEVSWYGAAAYCNWLSHRMSYQVVYAESGYWPSDMSQSGYHLPTEAQWERAAAWEPGYGHWKYGFQYPSIDYTRATYSSANPLNLSSFPYTSPVGYFNGMNGTVSSTSDAGCYDMCGNVAEWCNDWYEWGYYSSSPEFDPEGPLYGLYRVSRDGGWGWSATNCKASRRWFYYPSYRCGWRGFRVARNI
jgi:formylglycine-generating enzyme required for sulfatase activity